MKLSALHNASRTDPSALAATTDCDTIQRMPRTRPGHGDASPGTGSPAAIPDHTKLSVRVHLRLASCRNLLMRESRRSVERWGLTLPQFDILAELDRAPRAGFTFGELSRLLLVTSGNLTGIVDRLEADGLARREYDKSDRRVVRIVLTRKGRQLVTRVVPLHASDIEVSLAFMTAEQLTVLNELLGALREGLHKRPSESAVKAIDARAKGSRSRQLGSRRRRALLNQSDGPIAG